MTSSIIAPRALAALLVFCCGSFGVHAGVIEFSDQAPEYSSPRAESGFPIDLGVVSEFRVSAVNAISATVAGTWGNSAFSGSSAPADVFLDGILVASCRSGTVCTRNTGLLPWSYTFSAEELATGFLDDGVALVSVVQNARVVVRLGNLNLYGTRMADAVPEPEVLALLLLGLGGLASRQRRLQAS